MLQFNKCINEMNDAYAYKIQVQMWKSNTCGVTISTIIIFLSMCQGFVYPPVIEISLEFLDGSLRQELHKYIYIDFIR
jgi:hypothetical protein